MNISETLSLALNLQPQAEPPITPIVPPLSHLIERYEFPPQSLLFGVAEDSQPMLLNLKTLRQGAVLIVGDAGSGKTSFLRFLAQSAVWMYEPNEISFTVITPGPEGWQGWESLPHNLGILPAYDPAIKNTLQELRTWAQENKSAQQRLVLIDNLDALAHLDEEGLENLHWLLYNGAMHGLWMIVTMNTASAIEMTGWLPLFRVRLYGMITNPRHAEMLTYLPAVHLSALARGTQFAMRSKGSWLRFWLPNAE